MFKILSFLKQSRGHIRRQEVDSGRSEEEAFAAVIRPQTTSTASKTSQAPPGHSCTDGKSQRGATEGTLPIGLSSLNSSCPCTKYSQVSLKNVV